LRGHLRIPRRLAEVFEIDAADLKPNLQLEEKN
jgi:hypothetical protein